MGLIEIITIVLVILKVTHYIDWSWFWVLFPEILICIYYAKIVIVAWLTSALHARRMDKAIESFEKFERNKEI